MNEVESCKQQQQASTIKQVVSKSNDTYSTASLKSSCFDSEEDPSDRFPISQVVHLNRVESSKAIPDDTLVRRDPTTVSPRQSLPRQIQICRSPIRAVQYALKSQPSDRDPEKRSLSRTVPDLGSSPVREVVKTERSHTDRSRSKSDPDVADIVKPKPIVRPAAVKKFSQARTVLPTAIVPSPSKRTDVTSRSRQKEEAIIKQQAQCAFSSHRPSRPMGLPERTDTASQRQSPQIQITVASPQHDAPYRHSRRDHRTSSSSTSGTPVNKPHMRDAGESDNAPPTPLFERLVTEEVQELKTYARIIETQNQNIANLERIHDDLEARLEIQTKERMKLEAKVEEQSRMWAAKCVALEKEKETWKKEVQSERTRNESLMGQVNRKEKEILGMIQWKYDGAKNPPQQHSHTLRPTRSHQTNSSKTLTKTASSNNHIKSKQHKSPHELLVVSGIGGAVRERNVTNSLRDFFGL